MVCAPRTTASFSISARHTNSGDLVMTFPSWLRGLTHGSAFTLKKSRRSAVYTRYTHHQPNIERLEYRTLLSYDLARGRKKFIHAFFGNRRMIHDDSGKMRG